MTSQETGRAERPTRFILQWHITHRCNLSCVHCYQKDTACSASPSDFTEILDKYERFLKAGNYYGYVYLTGGEPLVHPAFFTLLEELRRRQLLFCVLSNGTLIDSRAANRIAWYGAEFVQVSLDGTREIHDRIRGKGAFDRALRGIDELTALEVPVLVSFTAQKGNTECFPELAKICSEHRVRKLWWDRVVTDTPEGTEKLALSTAEFQAFVKQAQRLNRKYRRRDGSILVSCERSLQFIGNRRADFCYSCHAGQDMITILADGSLMPCRRLPFIIGNIHDGELEALLSSDPLMEKLKHPPVPEGCLACAHADTCRGGAKCVTYGQTGSLFGKDVNCFL